MIFKAKLKKDGKCNIQSCKNSIENRGCCRLHYYELSTQIKKGQTNQEILEEANIFNPSRTRNAYSVPVKTYADYLRIEKERIKKQI